ncbi:MAG: phosphoenolpyruvate carboxykinase (GTP) [Deltaproteobacteria bacterium]|nr:phosphoenolpyruvate carboxykinase (GTP) [Deltaproteobacteria bacterium]MBN2674140.1 phosphoenolpyruvate carboxykinase (GTP) [Deltaproteobacteria bacterium]
MKVELEKGVDIVSDLGGLTSIEEAKKLIESKCDDDNKKKFSTIKSEKAILKIGNAVALLQPDNIWINSSSEADLQNTRDRAIENGEEFKVVNGHTCHFDLPEDQGRLVTQTFYIVNDDEDISVLAKKEPRQVSYDTIKDGMTGAMKGRTMNINFWNRGPVGAKAAIPAIMITDSLYVVHSGNILYPTCYESFDAEVERAGTFFFNLHTYADLSSENIDKARIYMDRSWQTTYSMYCTYAGNTLMLKKGNHRFHVDDATYYRNFEQLSEHMFITGMTGPGGRKTFIAGAAPSGCGKTTTAMVGTDFIGDDLAQMWIEDDGTVRAVNPEIGIFGIVKDVNREGDPFLMKALRGDIEAEVIYSNVLITEDGTPRWEGDGDEPPKAGKNFQGEWFEGKTDKDGKPIPMSHPNSRCTLYGTSIDNYNAKLANDPAGVPVKVITYSGRDSDTMPPVWVAKNADEGVVIGASIQSAATATEVGAAGVRRQPWANQPFIPGPLADYMASQLKFFNSDKIKEKPIMAGLNYFLTVGARGGEAGSTKLLGEKRDVNPWLSWLERRANGDVKAIDTAIGYLPLYDDLKAIFKETINKEYSEELYNKHFSLYADNIIARIDLQTEAYQQEKDCPPVIFEIYSAQKKALEELKAKFGSVISPAQLIEVGSADA